MYLIFIDMIIAIYMNYLFSFAIYLTIIRKLFID